MMADRYLRQPADGRLQSRHELRAQARVSLDGAPLSIIELARLDEDRRRHTQHPCILEQSGQYGSKRIASEIGVLADHSGHYIGDS